jgi:superfamily II DNA/RNA helicase
MAAASLVRNASMLLARPSRPLAPVRASQTRVDASAANWAAKRRVALRSNGAAAVDARRGLAARWVHTTVARATDATEAQDAAPSASESTDAGESSPAPPPEESAPADATPKSFADLGLCKHLCAALDATGFKHPSPPQLATIPMLNEGTNVAMQSYTGSGKTMAYLLPVLNRVVLDQQKPRGERANGIQCLVVVPSQELGMQIVRQVERVLGEFGKDITQQCIGGANIRRQEEQLRRKRPLVVVGTPGRIAELSRSGILRTHGVKCLVVDEADDLLASNFRRDMARIVDHVGKGVLGGRQTVIVSATLKRETLDQYSYMAPGLVHVKATRRELEKAAAEGAEGAETSDVAASLPPTLEHYSVVAEGRHKVDRLRRAIHATGAERALVFLNFGHRLTDTRDKLAARGMPCGVLHGGMNKLERANELAAFRRGDFRALLVSDLAARGIDVPEIDAVFNLDLPTDETHYVHRAGRTGRMGADGMVMTLADPNEFFVLTKIQRKLGIDIKAADLQKGRVVPDRGNKPTPRKEHAEARERREKEKGDRGDTEKGDKGDEKKGAREKQTRGERAAERRGTFEDEFRATRGFGAKPKGNYTPRGQPRRRNKD